MARIKCVTSNVTAVRQTIEPFDCCCRYFVMCGTAEKMLEYFLETYICVNYEEGDVSLDDFSSTCVVFMPANQICARLLSIYKAKSQQRLGETFDLALRETVKVIRFTLEWYEASGETFFENTKITNYLEVRR